MNSVIRKFTRNRKTTTYVTKIANAVEDGSDFAVLGQAPRILLGP